MFWCQSLYVVFGRLSWVPMSIKDGGWRMEVTESFEFAGGLRTGAGKSSEAVLISKEWRKEGEGSLD